MHIVDLFHTKIYKKIWSFLSYETFYHTIFIFTLFIVLGYLGLTIMRKPKKKNGFQLDIRNFSDQPIGYRINNISVIGNRNDSEQYLIQMEWKEVNARMENFIQTRCILSLHSLELLPLFIGIQKRSIPDNQNRNITNNFFLFNFEKK